MLEESAHPPIQGLRTIRCESHLLREHVQVRAVEQRRVRAHARWVRRGRHRTEDVKSHAAGQLGSIARDQYVAMCEGRDGGQGRGTQAVVDLQVAEREVIGQTIMLLRVLLQAADGHGRLGGGVGIAEDVVEIDARIAVGVQLLEHDARRDGQRIVRLDEEREARTAAVAVVGVLLEPAARLNGIDEPGQVMPVSRQARRHRIAKRKIEGSSQEAPFVALRHVLEGGVRHDFRLAELRLAGDVAHGAGLRPRTEQRPLGTAQHFEPIKIKQLEIGRKEGH